MEQIKIINKEWIKTENEYWIHKSNILLFFVSHENTVVSTMNYKNSFGSFDKEVLKKCKSKEEAHQLLEHTLRSL